MPALCLRNKTPSVDDDASGVNPPRLLETPKFQQGDYEPAT